MSTTVKCLAIVGALFYLSGILVAPAHATIVNVNAVSNHEGNAVVLALGAGDYDVTPVGVADGGTYNAWSAWPGYVSGCDSAGENCTWGWLNLYYFSSPAFPQQSISSGIYATDLLALSHALPTSFTLTSPTAVSFYIKDGTMGSTSYDNLGGMSLSVDLATPPAPGVPEPSTLFLLGTGLVGLGGFVWRHRRG